jgi:hypothetical protein
MRHTHVQGHGGLLEVDLALTAVDEALANVLHTDAADEVTHLQQQQMGVENMDMSVQLHTVCRSWQHSWSLYLTQHELRKEQVLLIKQEPLCCHADVQ